MGRDEISERISKAARAGMCIAAPPICYSHLIIQISSSIGDFFSVPCAAVLSIVFTVVQMSVQEMVEEEHQSLLEHQSSRSRSYRWWMWKWTASTLIVALLLIVIVLFALCIFRKERKENVIHVTTINAGAEYAGRLEMLIKSILLFHSGIVHIHVLADARAQEVLSMMFQTWRLKRLRWSLYELDRAHDRVDYIPTLHRAGNMGYLRMFAHDLLPLYVEKVILMDTDTIVLEDIAVLHSYFRKMEAHGAYFGASPDMYRRYGIRPKLPNTNLGTNVGVVLLDLKRMRQTNWDDLWREETMRLMHQFGPPSASEQDTFASFEYFHPSWCYRLPCEYNFQLGEWAVDSICLGDSMDYDRIKIPHWTEDKKWTSNKTSARHFTRLYQCIQMIDWKEMNGEDTDRNMAPARTLLYMREGEKPNSGEITLSVSTPFNESFAWIGRVGEWPGAVDLIVIGNDLQRMIMRDFLGEQKNKIGTRVSVHFVHRRSDLEVDLFTHYLHKLSADITRTDLILLAFDINALDISHQSYAELAAAPSGRFTAIYSKGKSEIGLLTNKKNAQRFTAEGKSLKETANILRLNLSNFTSAHPTLIPPSINATKREYPSFEFCRSELDKRKPIIDLPF